MTDLTARSHKLRAALSAEMHVRRLPRFGAPAQLLQIVVLLGEGSAGAGRAHIVMLGERHGVAVPDGARHAVVPMAGGVTLVWEGHTEFASYTLIRERPFRTPFAAEAFADLVAPLLDTMPGEVIRATRIAVLGRKTHERDRAALEVLFEQAALVVCDVADGKARVMSDFTLHDDGFGRLLVADRGLEGDEVSQLVTRVQELGNYRNMALLGLPVAQGMTAEVSALEQQLATLTRGISESASSDEVLLEELTFISAELARLAAATRYRMGATRAYAQLSLERLASLKVAAVPGYQSLTDFTERRLVPAMRTCDSFSQRIDDLSERAAWTSELLRTRIDTALARQNRDLLTQMNRRTQIQLRLQQTVEGLSVVAISYYLVGLVSDVAGAIPGIGHDVARAVAVPVVLLAVWLGVRSLRRRLTHGLDEEPSAAA